jgi:hypothetical protein
MISLMTRSYKDQKKNLLQLVYQMIQHNIAHPTAPLQSQRSFSVLSATIARSWTCPLVLCARPLATYADHHSTFYSWVSLRPESEI